MYLISASIKTKFHHYREISKKKQYPYGIDMLTVCSVFSFEEAKNYNPSIYILIVTTFANFMQFTVNSSNVTTKDNFELIITGLAKFHNKIQVGITEFSLIHAFKEYSLSKGLFDFLPILKDPKKLDHLRYQLNLMLSGNELDDLKILTIVLKNKSPQLIDPDLETLQIQKKRKFSRLFRR